MFDINFDILPKAMDASLKKQQAIAQNIANYNTPNYKRKTISFEEELSKAVDNKDQLKLKTNKEQHLNNTLSLEKVQAKEVTQDETSIRNDGNNVDIDAEVADMVQNTLKYNGLTRMMTYAINRYNTAIRSIK
ncbi:flagellar basal body rod protein FlgB [Geotoga petraea]|uniref:Flagellar basal body rod protein FlgB n=1 Tax=Geotoga petraea TaxID=28234 RepID=A0A4Z0W753_9BACT|nr:flagellar basal body rod protein FlgB [Geotoga petraea]MDK2945269.1 flagellar basal-body rod protein FlgB [Geotoga sp.]TGG89215.1 flagellar basal body rod protein FlgB [Geotoga petraea]